MNKGFCLLLVALILAACTPSEAVIQTAIAETEASKPTSTMIPTETVIPTVTSTLTKTSTPTRTATPTKTATRTALPTSTPTVTNTPPLPEEVTATAVKATADARIMGQTQTAVAISDRATATRAAWSAQATKVASYKEIYWKDLATYADMHKGEKVIVRGRVFNVNSDREFQIFFSGTYEAAYIVMVNPYTDLYEDQVVTVYGVVKGENCGTNAYGGEICQPLIIGDWFTRP